MVREDDLYCQLFVDISGGYDEIISLVEKLLNGRRFAQSAVKSKNMELHVVRNREHDLEKMEGKNDGFLFYPFYFDLWPNRDTSDVDYKVAVNNLIRRLSEMGMKSVPACEFEDELTM